MSEEHPVEFATSGNGPRYDYSAAAAAEILNLHFDPTQPKAVLLSRSWHGPGGSQVRIDTT